MSIPIRDQILFIKDIRSKYGLSADGICDIVSSVGGYVSVFTVRRIVAKGSESKNWRADTVAPVYKALHSIYSEVPSDPPRYAFPSYSREQYEQLIQMLKSNIESLRKKNTQQEEIINKQRKIIEILWHGLQCPGDYEAVVKKYTKEGGAKNG